MTPAPTPQHDHDHGSAGFCGNHAQPPDERTDTVARVLRDRVNLDTGRYEGCEARLDEVILASHTINERVLRIEGAPEVIAAVVVAALDDETARLRAEVERLLDGAAIRAAEQERIAVQRDAARVALDRVRAVPSTPGDLTWLNLSRRQQIVYRSGWEAAGRECRRAALDPEEPR